MFMNSEDNARTREQNVTEGCIVHTEGTGCHCRAPLCRFKEQDVTADLHSADFRIRMSLQIHSADFRIRLSLQSSTVQI